MKNKFKPTLNIVADEINEEEEKQVRLHRKHKDVDKDTVIIERGPFDTIASVLLTIVKTLVWVLLVALAAIGLASLLFPETRELLLVRWQEVLAEIGGIFR